MKHLMNFIISDVLFEVIIYLRYIVNILEVNERVNVINCVVEA